jgi:hypothetical protein
VHQVIGMKKVMRDLSKRLNTESQVFQLSTQFTKFVAQFSGVPAALQQLSNKMDKYQSAPAITPHASQLTSPRVECTVPIHTSTPYQHPNSRSQDVSRSSSFFSRSPKKR